MQLTIPSEPATAVRTNEFTREDVKALRIAQGMKPDPRVVLSQWVSRGVVSKDVESGMYVKC